MLAGMETSDLTDKLAGLPLAARQLIYSQLPPDDLVSVFTLSKAYRADVVAFVKEPPKPLSRGYGTGDWLALYLDSLAALYLLDAKLAMPKKSKKSKGDKDDEDSEPNRDPICVAAALVNSKKPRLIITSNTRTLPAARTMIARKDRNAAWEVQGAYDLSLKDYVKAWLHCIDPLHIPKAGKLTGIPETMRKTTRAELEKALEIEPEIRGGSGYLHAEMQILDLLWNGTVRPIDDKGVVYIGLTLLCCRHCWRAIQAFNKCFADKHTGKYKYACQVDVPGTHDTPYVPKNWNLPQFLITDKDARKAFLKQYKGERVGFLMSQEPAQTKVTRPNVLQVLD